MLSLFKFKSQIYSSIVSKVMKNRHIRTKNAHVTNLINDDELKCAWRYKDLKKENCDKHSFLKIDTQYSILYSIDFEFSVPYSIDFEHSIIYIFYHIYMS